VNQQKIQAVRAKREEQPFAGRGRSVAPSDAPQEEEMERIKRMITGA
jgi:hypothetical protein